jgi:hypothetical protein
MTERDNAVELARDAIRSAGVPMLTFSDADKLARAAIAALANRPTAQVSDAMRRSIENTLMRNVVSLSAWCAEGRGAAGAIGVAKKIADDLEAIPSVDAGELVERAEIRAAVIAWLCDCLDALASHPTKAPVAGDVVERLRQGALVLSKFLPAGDPLPSTLVEAADRISTLEDLPRLVELQRTAAPDCEREEGWNAALDRAAEMVRTALNKGASHDEASLSVGEPE